MSNFIKKIFKNWVTEVRSKSSTPLETTGGNSFSLEGFEKCFLQFKTLRRVIYIPLEGFRYLSKGFIALQIKGFHFGNRVDCITSAQRYSGPTQTSFSAASSCCWQACSQGGARVQVHPPFFWKRGAMTNLHPPPLVPYKRNCFHKFLKSSYKLYNPSKNWFPNQIIIYLCYSLNSSPGHVSPVTYRRLTNSWSVHSVD